jgi:hypothetical protein
MMITVEENVSIVSVLIMANTSQMTMHIPEMKANRDKNKSQRISDFSVK